MRDAEAVLISESTGQTATVDLTRDDSGAQTWQKTNGFLDLGSTGGIWQPGAFQDSGTQLLVLFDGPSAVPANAVVVFEHMPAHFIDRFCVSFAGDGSIIAGLTELDKVDWTMDVNPCS